MYLVGRCTLAGGMQTLPYVTSAIDISLLEMGREEPSYTYLLQRSLALPAAIYCSNKRELHFSLLLSKLLHIITPTLAVMLREDIFHI